MMRESRAWAGWTKSFAFVTTMAVAALILASCGTSETPTPVQEATPTPTAAPTLATQPTPTQTETPTPVQEATPTPTAAPTLPAEPTPTPVADGQTQEAEKQEIRVGTIESIEGDALSVMTVDGVILATLSDDTVIRRYAAGSLEDLSVGQRVSIGGRGKIGEELAARQDAVTLEGTSLYFETRIREREGQQGGSVVGTIEGIEGESITVKTEKGSFVFTISFEETNIQVPSVASIEDLSPGQQVTVTGAGGAEGVVEATSILVMPDVAFLLPPKQFLPKTGEREAEGRETQAETPIAVLDQERKAGENEGITFLVTQGSKATFTVLEKLAMLPLSSHAVMRTNALSGQIHLNGRPSVVEIDLHQLSSDQSRRDQFMRGGVFKDHPTAVFTIEDGGALPDGFTDGEDVTAKVNGLLNIRGVEVPLSFDIEARDDGDVIFILGRTSFVWSDFGMEAPANVIARVTDEVKVEILLAVRPLLDSVGS